MKRYARFLIIGLVLVAWATTADAQQLLKQSTAATVRVGPFLDEDDGKTAETALTVSQADVRLSKAGGAFAQKNETSAATHDENGWYSVDLDATDTGTLGQLTIAIHESGALPVWQYYTVVPANTYDSLVAGTDSLDANAIQLSGSATAADNAEVVFDTDFGTAYDSTNNRWNLLLATDDLRKIAGFKTLVWIDTTDNLETIVEAQSAGTLCLLGSGVHTITANVDIPDGVSIRGMGIDVTTVQTTTDSVDMFTAASDCIMSDMTVRVAATSGGRPIVSTGSNVAKNFVGRNLRLVGNADTFFVLSFNSCRFHLENVWHESKFDGLVLSGATAHEMRLVNNYFDLVEDSGGVSTTAISMSGANTSVLGYNVHINCENGAQVTRGIKCAEGRLELHDSTIEVNGQFASSNIYVQADGNATLVNCEFDRDATDISGTFVDLHTPTTRTLLALPNAGPDQPGGLPISDAGGLDIDTLLGNLDAAISTRSTFNPASDPVANVTLVATTTTNSDMRGTDNAFLAASAPTNFSDLAISATTGLVTTDAASRTASQADVSALATSAEIAALNDPTAATIADAVWDEATAGHVGVGSFGLRLADAATTSELDAAQTVITDDIATMDAVVDAILVDTGTTIPGILGTPAGASLAADIAGIEATVSAEDIRAAIGMAAADLDAQLDGLSTDIAGIEGGQAVAVNKVDDSRTWFISDRGGQFRATNIVTVNPTFAGDFAMDFAEALNPETLIATVDSVTYSPAGPTATSLTKSGNGKEAMWTVGSLTTGTTYTVTVTVTTNDSQTIPITATLSVQ